MYNNKDKPQKWLQQLNIGLATYAMIDDFGEPWWDATVEEKARGGDAKAEATFIFSLSGSVRFSLPKLKIWRESLIREVF